MHEIKTITVVGAGQMGHQIAMLGALGGYDTILCDIDQNNLEKAGQTLKKLMIGWVQKQKITEQEKEEAFERLAFTGDLQQAAGKADFIIEAVVEKLDVKQQVFSQLDEWAPIHTVLATNSSTIVNSLLSTKRPDRVVNMHFFYPPLVMDCVEVVMSDATSEQTAQAAMTVSRQINRTAVLLRKEISGFVANRILGALQKEALYLYEEGIADYKEIDTIVKKALRHPIGPFELMDLSGIDVGYFVQQQRYQETNDPEDKPAASVEEKVRQGHLGRKTGQGWYTYTS